MCLQLPKDQTGRIDLRLMKLPTEEVEEVLSAALPAEEAGETPPRLSPASCVTQSKEEVVFAVSAANNQRRPVSLKFHYATEVLSRFYTVQLELQQRSYDQ